MTNAEIILNNRVFLMEEGLLKPTEETILINGKETSMPEEIHTYGEWRRRGYQVQKGEHAIARFPIWTFKPNKKQEQEEEEDPKSGRMFMKVAFFFKKDQVQKIKG